MRFKFLIFICAALMSANALYSAVLDTIPEIVWEKTVYGISNIFVGPNDQYVMTVGGDANYLIFHNPENGEPTDTLNYPGGFNHIVFTNDATMFAVNRETNDSQTIFLYDANTKKLIKVLKEPGKTQYGSLAFSSNNKYLAIPSNGHGVTVWDVEANKIVKNMDYPTRSGDTVEFVILSAKFTPDNKYLIARGAWYDSVQTYNGWKLNGHDVKKIFSVENNFDSVETDVLEGIYSKTGKYCLTYDENSKMLNVWDYASRKIVNKLSGFNALPGDCDFTSDDKYVMFPIGTRTKILELANTGELLAKYWGSFSHNRFSKSNNYFIAHISEDFYKIKSPWTKTGIEETESGNELIYPNPANNTFTIDLVLSVSGNYKMIITDASGKTVQTCDLGYLDSGKQSITGNLKEIASGSYIVSVVGYNQIKSFKVVVE